MPKRFGFATQGLVVLVVVSSLVGCRSATTQLAGVPGLGWLDRTEEGWANYEPAPPKPSATAEPTGAGESAIVKSDSPFAGAAVKMASSQSKPRFDGRYLDKPGKKVSTFGDYASAYGKYGSPKSGDGPSVQSGPYDAGSVASAAGGKAYVKPGSGAADDGDAKKEPYGYVSNSRFNSEPKTDAALPKFQPAYTASANSRFGAEAAKAAPATTSTYTPPGFPKSSPATGQSFSNRFDNAANGVADRATGVANNAAQSAMDAGQQTFNKFGNAASNAANDTIAKAKNAAGSFTNNMANTAQQKFNQYTAPANKFDSSANPVADAANTAKDQFNSFANGAKQFTNPMGNTAGNQSPGTFAGAAQNALNSATAQAKSTYNTTVANAKDVVSGYQNAAQDAVGDVANRFGNAASTTPNVGQSLNSAVQNTTQGLANGVKSYAQGAVNTAEQSVASVYQNAKNTAGNYANSAINNVTQGTNNMVNGATNSVGQAANAATQNAFDTAAAGINQTRNAIKDYAATGQQTFNNAVNNVTAPAATSAPAYPSTTAPAYPTTSAPNSVFGPASTGAKPASVYSAPSAPASAPKYGPVPSIQRSVTPFRPGSTNLQGQTVRKQSVELASAEQNLREPLQLAVGDQYQFPRSLR